jgi:PAS domain S-box-containing protein
MTKEIEVLKRKLLREQKAKTEAEKLLEEKSLELFKTNQQLKTLNSNLENLIVEKSQKLITAENEYHVLVESISDLILKTDLSGKIIYANQIAEKILNRETAQLIGKTIFNYIPPSEKKRIIRLLNRQFLNHVCLNYLEIQIPLNENENLWFGVTIQFSEDKCITCDKKLCYSLNHASTVKASSECSYQNVIIVARDITEQKRIRLNLEKSEKRYRELINSIPELVCEINSKGEVTSANQISISAFGYTNEEFWSKPFSILKIFSKKDHERLNENMKKVLEFGERFSNEYVAIRKNGTNFPVIVYSSPIYNANSIVGIHGVMIDITDRKKHELEKTKNLKRHEIISEVSLKYNTTSDFSEKTQQVIEILGKQTDVSRVYIFEDSSDGKSTSNTYEWCNKNSKSRKDALQNISYSEFPSWHKLLIKKGIIYSEDMTDLPPDLKEKLEYKDIKSIIVLPLLVEGKIFGFIGFNECQSERVWNKADLELFRIISTIISNAYFRSKIYAELSTQAEENIRIINSIPDQIVRIAENGKIISLDSPNRKSSLFRGYEKDSKDDIYSLFDQELASSFQTGIKECLTSGLFQFDFSFLNWDELEFYEARFSKLKGNVVMAIIRDVTELKENEKLLKIAKVKAEEASRAKSEFIANVSHEIRTPMNAILGFSEWLHDNVTNELHKSYLHTVMSSGRNLLTLINDILDLSKIESGKLTLQIEPTKVALVIQEIQQVFSQKLEEKNLTFNLTIDKSVPIYIFMDTVRFYQILFNIIGNGIKFTSKGYIHVSVWAEPCNVENAIDLMVRIEDTGIGINEDQQEHIFNAFTQQSGQSNRHYEGTGLGLSIVNGLLKRLNAEVKLKSNPGEGSTFTLKFNEVKIAEVEEAKDGAELKPHKDVLNAGKILIVDDVDFNIKVLKRIIDSDKVTFLEAQDGQQALCILETEHPDIIFMDIMMPGISGYTTTELIKKQDRLKDIPVVAFTASTMNDDTDKINSLFDAFLQKPALRKDVYAVLTKFLSNKFDSVDITNQEVQVTEISEECRKNFPLILKTLKNEFLDHWIKIKDDLIIFEIEEFYDKLNNFSKEKDCRLLNQYCLQLSVGIQSLDIEKIKKKISEFPELIEKLNSFIK